VLLTHLHFDHCGGTVKRKADGSGYELTFPNATHWVSSRQWEWAVNANRREKASFLTENIIPIMESGKLKLFDSPFELIPGMNIRLFDGHTEGQAIPFISYKGKTVVFMGDTIPTSAHLPLPYIMSYDTKPLVSLDEKEMLLEEAAENGYIFFFEHDLYRECCTVERGEKGIKVKEFLEIGKM
jgi:glyoxylase-like metal-dependent hydrolase (beta-lactamase superfamily II)